MNKVKSIFNKKIEVDFSTGFIVTIVLSLITTFLILFLSSDLETFKEFLLGENFFYNYFKNFVPVFFILIIFYCLTNNLILSNGFLIIIFSFLAIANRIKISFRQTPLNYFDFVLIKEVRGSFKNISAFDIIIGTMAILVVFLVIIILSFFIKTKKSNMKSRVALLGSFSLLFILVNSTLLTSSSVYQNTSIEGNQYSAIEQYNTNGFLYSFIYKFNNRNKNSFENLDLAVDEKNIDEYEAYASIETDNLPVIIMIQSEAYSDFGINDKINFDGFVDPYENYKKIINDSYSGKIVVPNFGGGTSDTEFDVLTGMNSRFLRQLPYSNAAVQKDVDSIASILKKIGYYSIAVNPVENWYYDRLKTFELLGFDESMFIDSFNKDDMKGGYISEKQTFEKIKRNYENFTNKNNSVPYFSFNMTIQNHAPFYKKYNSEKNFNTDLKTSPEENEEMYNYFEGIHDLDVELGELIKFFENENRPVVVVYWSDHLPGISEQTIRKLLYDVDENDILKSKLYEFVVPFFIWENSASKNTIGLVKKIEEKGINIPISDFYLSSLLLEGIGLSGLSYYMDFNIKMLEDYPILLESGYVDSEKQFIKYESEEKIIYYNKLMNFRLN